MCRLARRWSANTSRRRSFAGDHGSTYGGNLLSTRAGLDVLEELTGTTEPVPYRAPAGLIGHVHEMASVFEHALNRLAAEHDIVAAARGVGVMRALELTIDAAPVVEGALQGGTAREPHGRAGRADAAAVDRLEGRRSTRPSAILDACSRGSPRDRR